MILLLAVAGVVLLILLIIVICCCKKRSISGTVPAELAMTDRSGLGMQDDCQGTKDKWGNGPDSDFGVGPNANAATDKAEDC